MTLSQLRPSTKRTYQYIIDFIRERGYSPTLREIKAGVPLSSTSVATYHREQLIKAGLLTFNPDRDRGIAIAGASTLTFYGPDADYIRKIFGDISGADLVRKLRNEEAMASWGQTRP